MEQTAMYFSGLSWEPYATSWLKFPYHYVADAVSAPCLSIGDNFVYGTNHVAFENFEEGSTSVWKGGRVVAGGYLSDYALYSTKSDATDYNCVCSAPIPIGKGIPLDTWCNVCFQVRTAANVTAGLGVLAVITSSTGKTYTFELSVADRSPLSGDNWREMSMGFQLSLTEDLQLSLTEQRYDWCYLLPNHCIPLETEETLVSATFIFYADAAELWFDDIDITFEKPNPTVRTAIHATPSLAAVGEEFTVTYELENSSDFTMENVPYAFRYNPLIVTPLAEVEGIVTLKPNAARRIEARFRVLEGGAAIIQAGGTDGMACVHTRVSCTGRGVYYGDSHSHSNESDGKTTPYENLKQYYRLGMSFNISADHNVEPRYTQPWDDALAQLRSEIINPERFLQIKATENSVNPNHAVQYFSENRYDTPTTHEGWQEVIRKQKEDGGLTYIAHPFLKTDIQFWPILEGPSVILPQYKEADGFEIINSQTLDYTAETIPKALEWWDRYNITGYKKYFGIGNSDGHRLYELAGSYNGLLLEELTEDNIKAAFANGNLFFTTGPQLRYTLGGVDMGGNMTVSNGTTVPLHVTAYTPNGTPLEKVVVYHYTIGENVDVLYQDGQRRGIVLYQREYGKEDISLFNYNGEITVNAGEFVRVEVYAARDPQAVMCNYQMAMSNPIWVTGV